MVFDEKFYAMDACRYVSEGAFLCGIGELTYAHPPVGKWLIASGIWALGPTPLGARLVVALVGTLSVGVLFMLARLVLDSTAGAGVAALLLAIDPLHLVTSRTALLEVFASFFVLLSLLCFSKAMHGSPSVEASPEIPQPVSKSFLLRDVKWPRMPWRLLAGIALGLAIGSKWTVAPVALALVIWGVWDAVRRRKTQITVRPATREGLELMFTLVVVPLLVYAFSFVGRLDAAFLAVPWSEGSWFRAFGERQLHMLEYHLELRRVFVGSLSPAYESPPWSWPLIKRAIPFSFSIRGGVYREVVALGNPLVWWPALVASVAVITRGRWPAAVRGVLVVGLGGTFLFWLPLSPVSSNVFIYYLVPAIPFLCLAIAVVATAMFQGGKGRVLLGMYLLGVVSVFAFFFPVLTWAPLTESQWDRRMIFTDCVPRPAGERPIAGYEFSLGNPPVEAYGPDEEGMLPLRTDRGGWCWL